MPARCRILGLFEFDSLARPRAVVCRNGIAVVQIASLHVPARFPAERSHLWRSATMARCGF
jgi:hypothetical protein